MNAYGVNSHSPSKKQAIIFFVFSLLLAAGVLAWTFVFNKGFLVVEGQPPFSIGAGGQSLACNAKICSIKLSPGTYNVRIAKDGYSADSQTAVVRRGKSVLIKAGLKFIPQVREIETFVLPLPQASLRPPFLGKAKLVNFPREFKNALFSPDGSKVLVYLGRELYIYSTAEEELNKVNLPADTTAVWAGGNLAYLAEEDGKHLLKIYNGSSSELIAVFEKPFASPRISGSLSGRKILITEQNGSSFSYYLIDADKKSRRKLDAFASATKAKWGIDYLFFEQTDGSAARVSALNVETLTAINLPADGIENLSEVSRGTFLFASPDQPESASAATGVSISDVLENIQNETLQTNQLQTSFSITEYRPTDNQYLLTVNVPLAPGERIQRLTADPDGKKLYFTKTSPPANQEKLFDILLSPPR